MTEKKMWIQNDITCKPLDSLEEIMYFLDNPPSWRSLCKELVPHSENVIRNEDINKFFGENLLETPQTFCHYDPEAEEVERQDRKKLPKTLVCHDMANGYHEDSFIDGTGDYSAYTFYNWAGIDIFCYFSHHFITIPPLGWINVGHAHGVKVIGTVITEWAEGVLLWDKILSSEDEWRQFASALVAIAAALKFDGWLLNVENKISKPEELLRFVRHLHSALHRELPGAALLWYDSVTAGGHLRWQNGLNDNNRDFFDATDGIFTNYSWTERDIEGSVAAAGARLADLYVGIDVWGRNFHGGGQFNTREAIEVAHRYGCSLAIFAPAWTHEALSDDPLDNNTVADAEDLDKFEKFMLRDRAFWCSIWPYLNTRLPTVLPFKTSFCRGLGKKRRLYGEVICPVPWYNLRHMQYQPNSLHGPHGYLLSTKDNISNICRYGFLKTKDGILRYRRSFEAGRNEIGAGKSKEVALSIRTDSVSVLNQEETVEITNESEEGRKTVKRKMKNAFRSLFKIKASKTEHAEEPPQTQVDDTSERKSVDISGRSMVQLSINVRLGGRTDKTRFALAYVSKELECLEQFYEDSFLGGSCLKVNPADGVSSEHWQSRIFFCDFFLEGGAIAVVVTKNLPGHENQFLNVKLNVVDGDGQENNVVLAGRCIPHGHEEASGADIINLYPFDEREPEFRELQRYLLLNEPGFYIPVENAYGWKVRYYSLAVPRRRVRSVSCRAGLHEGPVLLGHLALCPRREEAD